MEKETNLKDESEIKTIQQYNNIGSKFVDNHEVHNHEGNQQYYKYFPEGLLSENKKVIDMGCGDGSDIFYFSSRGKSSLLYGIDSSQKMVDLARAKNPNIKIDRSSFDKLPYEDNFFDVAMSKWAIQYSKHIHEVYKEVFRVLKHNGVFIFLVPHPICNFMSKKKPRNYFKKELFDSKIFDGKVAVTQYSHTISEYFSEYFLSNFHLKSFFENTDPSVEVMENAKYPAYFIAEAVVKKN